MAITLSEQWRVWPGGGAEIEYLVDGEGMHSLVPYDLVRHLNNLGSYCMNYAQFAFPHSDLSSFRLITPGEASGEQFLSQMPVVVPMGATRMCWTAAIVPDLTGGAISVNSLKMYLSVAAYNGTGGSLTPSIPTAYFDPATRSHSVSQVASTAVYSLYVDTSTGVTPLDLLSSPVTSTTGQARISWAILTMTFSGASGGSVYLQDQTVWFNYE